MEALFMYFGKVTFTSGVLFLYYKLFLKDKTFHHYNRFYLLAVVGLSFTLPAIKLSYFTLEVDSSIYLLLKKLQSVNSTKNSDDNFFYFTIGAVVAGWVSVFFISKLIFGLFKIQQIKKNFTKEYFEGIHFYQTNLEEAPFSFFKNLFWKDSIQIQSDLGRQILKHEMVHIEQKHSWDKIFLEMATSLFWFNPFFYLIRKEISLIHEYLADKKAIKNSDTKAFAQMLLASHFSGKALQATSPFLSSNLKKRLTMLKKSKTKYSYARKILALPLLFAVTFIYMVNAKNKEIKETNKEMAGFVAAIKKDTIPPPPVPPALMAEDPPGLQQIEKKLKVREMELKPMNDLIVAKSKEAEKISAEMQVKSKELEKLANKKDFDNPKFKALEKDLNLLGEKMNLVFEDEEFKNSMKRFELKQSETDNLYAKIDSYYNSDEFNLKIKNAEAKAAQGEKYINSPAFRKTIRDAERKGKDAEKLVNSPAFKKKIKDAEKYATEAAEKMNTPAFKIKLQKAEENANVNGNPTLKLDEDIDIFIEGKLSTNEAMKKLDPNTIESMNVLKKGFTGKKKGEIHIKLKK